MSRRPRQILRCKKCNRQLTDRESMKRGYGPTCFGKMPAMIFQQLEEAGQMRFQGIR